MNATPLLLFYRGTGTDSAGRTIAEILSWDDDQLEMVHDYIQWLFPLPERSAYNISAPLLTIEEAEMFKYGSELRKPLLKSFARIVRFYGFEPIVDCKRNTLERSEGFEERLRNWLTPSNHNFLRITRILRSLTLLDCEYAPTFLNALEKVYDEHPGVIGNETLNYWRNAVHPK